MKKILLQAGIITIGSLSILSEPIKVYAGENKKVEIEKYDYSKVLEVKSQAEKEEIVRKYSKIYELKENVILKKIKELTNDLLDLKIVTVDINDNLSNYEMNVEYGIDEGYENEELALFYLVRDISKNPNKYDLEYDDINSGIKYETDECYEDLLKDACDLIEVNKEDALAISLHECGADLGSSNFRNNNNPAGLGPHNYYKNIAVGVYEYAIVLKEGYHCTMDSDASFFDRIGHIYCQDGSNWSGMVKSFYYNIEEDYYYYSKIYGRKGKVLEKENVK